MYIPEFWCGVAVTIGVEFIGIIILCIVVGTNKSRNNKHYKTRLDGDSDGD